MEDIKIVKQQRQQEVYELATFILDEVGEKINELMIDRYGNYLFQELIRKCNENGHGATKLLSVLTNIKPNFIQICTDKKGTHAVQRLIDMIASPEEEKALSE